MGLIRTILAFVILVILSHIVVVYANVEASTNSITEIIYSLGILLESPAQALLSVVPIPAGQENLLDPNNFYSVAVVATAGYFILYLLLGIGRHN